MCAIVHQVVSMSIIHVHVIYCMNDSTIVLIRTVNSGVAEVHRRRSTQKLGGVKKNS